MKTTTRRGKTYLGRSGEERFREGEKGVLGAKWRGNESEEEVKGFLLLERGS